MAWLQADPSGNYHISFRFGGRRFKRSLRTKDQRRATSRLRRLEENIQLIESGRLDLPVGTDIPSFLLSDGKLHDKPAAARPLTLAELIADYLAGLPEGSLESGSLYTARIHMEHIKSTLGARFIVTLLTEKDLQQYVLARSRAKGRKGMRLRTTTIKKELGTFSSLWSWAMLQGYVTKPFPSKGLRFPKTSQKPPFQTWQEIERQANRGGLTAAQEAELWDCLFLTVPEVSEVLRFVEANSRYPYLHPMIVFAAHTGARRSEMMRSQIDDIDLEGSVALVREKKKVRGKSTMRRVPLSPHLHSVLRGWLKRHPGGNYTFCHPRATDNGIRGPLSGEQVQHHFRRTFIDCKWNKLRGWHVFRHSFCSNCAASGIDQRIINAWVGHQTEEMVLRYRHLIPNQEQSAIQLVFADG